jgi:DNA-binding CsgD family transcriptional regulator
MTKLRKNHRFLSSGGHIKQIAAPLQLLQTHMFTYMKNLHDGTQIYLSSNPQWTEDYYAFKLHDSSYFEGDPKLYTTGFKWWPEGSDLPVFTHGRDYFDSHIGMTYCQQVADGCEFFFFSSSNKDATTLDLYLNHLDLLEKFAIYFKDQAGSILRQSHKHRIQRSSVAPTPPTDTIMRHEFLQMLGMTNAMINDRLHNFEQLTARELECLRHLLDGSATAKIANMMSISIRTIETHIQNIKQKFQCRTKYELMCKLLSEQKS